MHAYMLHMLLFVSVPYQTSLEQMLYKVEAMILQIQ